MTQQPRPGPAAVGPDTRTFAGILAEGTSVGANLAFLDTALTYATGSVAARDFMPIAAPGLVLGLSVGGGAATVWRTILRHDTRPWIAAALVTALHAWPVLLAAVRGTLSPHSSLAERWWMSLARIGLTLFLSSALAAAAWWRASSAPRLVPAFFGLSAVSTSAAGLALLFRSVPVDLVQPHVVLLLGLILGHSTLVAATLGLAASRLRAGTSFAVAGLLSLSAAGATVFVLSAAPIDAAPSSLVGVRSGGRPNILLIVLDTVRSDRVSAYGYYRETTPNMDRLAQTSLLFENAYATAPYTLSSHASLFTGLLPSQHGAHPVPYARWRSLKGDVLADYPLKGHETLARRLSGLGYRTGGVAANSGFLAPFTGLDEGFQWYRCDYARRFVYVPTLIPVGLRWPDTDVRRAAWGWLKGTREASEITQAAIQWIDAAGAQPFFLFLNYYDAHQPFAPPPPFDRRFGPTAHLESARSWDHLQHRTPDQARFLAGQYDGCLAYVDQNVGRLLDHLRVVGLFDSMLVIVTSDHGEFFGEHGLGGGHGMALYEPVLRVPLVVKLPTQRTGSRSSARVSLADVPGLVERAATGAAPMAVSSDEPRVFAEYWTSFRDHEIAPNLLTAEYLRAIYWSRLKLIQKLGGPDELYDLVSDPAEARDLFHSDRQRAEAARSQILAALPPIESIVDRRAPPRLDADTLQRLRALGYLR